MKVPLKITPELIPHSEFHTGIWLQSVEQPAWYYFSKRKNPDAIANKNFIESVDEPLKELVKFLHKKGIKTTPSCSGHHINERNFEKIYDELKQDGRKIRNGGLRMKDVESGKTYLYQDKHYHLPWTKRFFLKEIGIYQQKGVLGMHLGNRKKIKHEILKLELEGVKIREKDSIVFLFTNEDRQRDVNIIWKEITRLIEAIFK